MSVATGGFARGRASRDFRRSMIAILFLALLAVAAVPLITHPLPPLSDYVNHLARMHVVATVSVDPDLARFYSIEWQIIQNLVMDLVVPPLARIFNIYVAGQIFFVATFALIMSGTLALNRALFGHWSAAPLIAFSLLYNGILLIGVMNYIFGIGVALWALAAWVSLRERAWIVRIAVSMLFVLVLFFSHLFGVGLYAVGVLAFELHRLWTRRDGPLEWRLIEFVSAGVPFLPIAPLLYASPTLGLASDTYWAPQGKLDGIILALSVYYDVVAFALLAFVIVAAMWAIRHRVLHFHPFGWALLLVGGIVYLAMPRILFASFLADQRVPAGLAFMVVACVHLNLRSRLVRRGFAVVLVILLPARVGEVQIMWDRLSRGPIEMLQSVGKIERGSRVLVVYADRSAGDDSRDLGLTHAACLAMIERSALVSTAFTVRGKQILRVRNAYADYVDTADGTPPSVARFVLSADLDDDELENYWDRWPQHYDYVYVLFTDPGAKSPDDERLTLVFEASRFQLYRVTRATDADN